MDSKRNKGSFYLLVRTATKKLLSAW